MENSLTYVRKGSIVIYSSILQRVELRKKADRLMNPQRESQKRKTVKRIRMDEKYDKRIGTRTGKR